MGLSFKSLALAAGIAAGSVSGASAAILDFTAGMPGATSGILGTTVTWELEAVGGALNTSTGYDGGAAFKSDPVANFVPLVLRNDGVGVGDDEVTNTGEELILKFSQAIRLQGVYFLDMFVGPGGGVSRTETSLSFNKTTGDLIIQTVATEPLPPAGVQAPGFAFSEFADIIVKTIRFVPGVGKDNNNGDFSLAAIKYRDVGGEPAPVPLPAGGVLLLGGLGGLALLRRRKKNA